MSEEGMKLLIAKAKLDAAIAVAQCDLVAAQAIGADNPVWLSERAREISCEVMSARDEFERVIREN